MAQHPHLLVEPEVQSNGGRVANEPVAVAVATAAAAAAVVAATAELANRPRVEEYHDDSNATTMKNERSRCLADYCCGAGDDSPCWKRLLKRERRKVKGLLFISTNKTQRENRRSSYHHSRIRLSGASVCIIETIVANSTTSPREILPLAGQMGLLLL
jgi:hypothetical protein